MAYKKSEANPLSGQRLKEEIKKSNLTQETFGARVELDPKYIGFMCQGRRAISSKRAKEFADILGVRPEYLLGLDDFRTCDLQWLKKSTAIEADKQSIFEHFLTFWRYQIIGNYNIYEEDENGSRVITGMNFRIKKPSGEIIEVDSLTVDRLITEILDFSYYKLQNL